jgi:hypothetical protein
MWNGKKVVFPVNVHENRSPVMQRGLYFRSMSMQKEHCSEERVVFPVHVHVKRARGEKRGLCFRSCFAEIPALYKT